MMANISQFDVVISGGGLSGLLTAVGLLNETPELSIAIIERYSPDTDHLAANPSDNSHVANSAIKNFDDRCLALSYGSLQLLNHWQIWSDLKPFAWPIKTIITSDRGHIGKTIMRAQEYGISAMGYVTAMKNMGAVFSNTLKRLQHEQVTWFCPDSVTSIAQHASHVEVTLSSQQQISGKLLVITEGANSPSRELLNISSTTEKYDQSAIIANVEVKTDSSLKHSGTDINTAFERFTTSGPIAFLPIANNQYSVVWSVKPEQTDDILSLPKADFIAQLQQAFGYSAGKIVNISQPSAYPLMLTKAQELTHDRVALIGNSAHTIHPIAGQGFNLGLRDVAVLVQQIKQAVDSKQDIGSFPVLNQYQQSRKQDIKRIADFTDLLVRAFAIEGRPAAATRTAGLMALQKCTSLQQWLALHFMSSKSF